jgi:pimeloyl-ACP methyl ester carboxylesterase
LTPASGRAVADDGVGLWWRLDGAGPTVLLVPGRGDSTDVFPADLSDALLGGGCSVLRYDPRDTGLSDDGGDAYTFGDMARDIVVVATAAGVGRIHVVALSMAGMVTVDLAVHHPSRVASIVFLGAMSPDPDAGTGSRFSDGIGADPVVGALASMGAPRADDETWMHARLASALQRAPARPDAAVRHQQAALRLGWPQPSDLRRVAAPTLVVHGGCDLVLPLAHAEALAAGVPGARLVVVDGLGHVPTRREWGVIAGLVTDHVVGVADPVG